MPLNQATSPAAYVSAPKRNVNGAQDMSQTPKPAVSEHKEGDYPSSSVSMERNKIDTSMRNTVKDRS